ncbi:MAG: hypothetical protein ACOX3Q_11870 [Clostridia bacterium]|jgi:hypothetical protein|nr:hypothetical protein [Clostridiaceae bacterium]
MDYYKNISKNLGEALKSIPLIEKISDYGVYICGVSLIFVLLSAFTVPFGGFLNMLFVYIFMFSLILLFIEYQNNYLLLGLLGYALTRLISMLFGFTWFKLAAMLLFLGLSYIVFKKIGDIKLKG